MSLNGQGTGWSNHGQHYAYQHPQSTEERPTSDIQSEQLRASYASIPNTASYADWSRSLRPGNGDQTQQRLENRAAETLSTLSNTAYGQSNSFSPANWASLNAQYPGTNVAQRSQQAPQSYATANTSQRASYHPQNTLPTPNFSQQSYYSSAAQSTSANNTGYERNSNTTVQTGSLEIHRSPRQQHLTQSRPSTTSTGANVARSQSGHSRVQSLTPSAVQQQARYMPPPPQESQAHHTVNPTQVYDPYLEQQRQAEKAAEERRKMEAEQAKKKAEEARIAQEEADLAAASEKAAAEQAKREAEAAKEAERKATEAREAREAAEQQAGIEQARELSARALLDANSEEGMASELKVLFEKMRQINAKNPALLSRMWEEERVSHGKSQAAKESSPAQKADGTGQSSQTATRETATPTTKSSTPANSKRPRGRPPKNRLAQNSPAQTKTKISQPHPPSQPDVQQTTAAPAAPVAPVALQGAAKAVTGTIPAPLSSSNTKAVSQVPPPATSPSQPSIWPPGRKRVLAAAAVKWLEAQAGNGSKSVTVSLIEELLDSNPSYPDLCAHIEATGLKFDRTQFAKTLLAAVPDLNKAQAAPKPKEAVGSTADADASTTTSVVEPDSVPHPVSGSAALPSPRIPRPYKKGGSTTPLEPRFASTDRAVKMDPASLSKEQAARKRDFTEFAAYANKDSSDDDEDVPPAKMLNVGDFDATLRDNQTATLAPADAMPASVQPQSKHIKARLAELQGTNLVEALRREQATRRDMYDPKTIARDVLLATGRHPDMRPLNGHLFQLQGLLTAHAKGVESHKYDLSTLRWDLIDPGDLPESEVVENSDDGIEADDESDGGNVMPIINIPIYQHTPNSDGTMTMSSTMTNYKLKPSSALKPRGPRHRPGRKRTKRSAAGTGEQQTNAPSSTTPSISNSLGTTDATGGSQRTSSRTTGPSEQRSSRSIQPSVSAPSPAPSQVTGYAAFRSQQFDADGHPMKKKLGRPVGWRKHIHGKAAQAAAAAGPSKSEPMKSRRTKQPNAQPDETNYAVYKCGWQNCGAELHNIDTLRKHVVKVHGLPTDNLFHCRWTRCTTDSSSMSAAKGKAPASAPVFPSIQKWMAHVETLHIQPLGQSLGDGPRRGLSDAYDSEASQAYLSDTSGRIVTPRSRIDTSIAEEDEIMQSETLAPVLRRGMPRVRGTLSGADRENEQMLQNLEAKKLALGPFWEKGGCRLANENRRKGLYDDEDFGEEVSADDGPESSADEA